MSELTDLIESAHSRIVDAETAIDDARDGLAAAASLLESQEDAHAPDVTAIISGLDDALSDLSRAEDNIPNRYTEVGEVADMGDSLEGYISDAKYAIEAARDALESLDQS